MGGNRFHTVNRMTITYTRIGGNAIQGIFASAILNNPMLVDPDGMMVRVEQQKFVFNLSDLMDNWVPFTPKLGEIIEDSYGQKFEIIRETQESPIFQYVTADRTLEGGRIIVNTQRIEK